MAKKKTEKKEVQFIEGLKAKEVLDIPLEDIDDDVKTFQYRLSANVGDLKRSLSQEGQKEPIDLTGSKPYRIIDGFRRVGAIKALGWKTVKALVHKGIQDQEAHKLAFIKNVVRKNLSPMDKANAIFQAKQRKMKPDELTEYFGLSKKQLKRYEELLDFPSDVQKLLEKETIPMGHAKVLADFEVSGKELGDWIARIVEDGLTEKQVKRELKKSLGEIKGGKYRLYMKRENNGVRMYPFFIGKEDSKEERDRVIKLLQEAIEALKG